jgi:hypothetical protein
VARAKGVKLGRRPTLDAHRAEIDRLRKEGYSGRAIAKELGIPSSSPFKLIGVIEGEGTVAARFHFLLRPST